MCDRFLAFLFLLVFSFSPCSMYSQDVVEADSVQMVPIAPDENFVEAYVVVISPGTVMYSVLGHACLRLQCDTHHLDYIFSFEGEDTEDNIVRFFRGNLMMGVRAVPTQEFLQEYIDEGRGVNAYKLNLPISVKQRLWQQMDERLETEMEVPYDFINRGCAISASHWIRNAIDRDSLTFGDWPDKYKRTRKEMALDTIPNEWTAFALCTFTAGESEYNDLAYEEKITLPTDLVEVLQHAQAYGRPLLDEEAIVLAEKRVDVTNPFVTPLMVSLLFMLVVLVNLFLHVRVIRCVVWAFQFLVSLFIVYLVVFSSLPCTQWNWLIIPFTPLPVLMWRWRRHWAAPYVLLCAVWMVALLIYPHQVLVPTHYVLAFTLMLSAIELNTNAFTRLFRLRK